jgi:murein DD-endopeptidase MepM/ murein hydrolase activator NlpD
MRIFRLLVVGGLILGLILLIRAWRNPQNQALLRWATGDENARATLIAQRDPCATAPFKLPTDGFVGLLWNDPRGPYSQRRRHQGIDIFSNEPAGTQPVYAVADGFIYREADWVSTVIQRIPSDPLQPDQQVWVYYTHMADAQGNDFIEPQFARGVTEVPIKQGERIGYVGNYDGNVPSRIWTHLHLSVVKERNGTYLNEYFIDNTRDPSPYFGMRLDYESAEAAHCPLEKSETSQ